MSTFASHSSLNISEIVRGRGLVLKDHQQEMAYNESNGHMTDDLRWHRMVKLVILIRLKPNI